MEPQQKCLLSAALLSDLAEVQQLMGQSRVWRRRRHEERRRQMFDCWCVAVTSGLARRGMEQDGDRRLISIFPNSTLVPPSWEARGYLSARLD